MGSSLWQPMTQSTSLSQSSQTLGPLRRLNASKTTGKVRMKRMMMMNLKVSILMTGTSALLSSDTAT